VVSSGASGTPPEGEITRGREEARTTAEEVLVWVAVVWVCTTSVLAD